MSNALKYYQILINISIFCFFTLLLVFPKGYNYGSTALLVASILFLFYAIYKKINVKEIIQQNKAIFISISFYFSVSLFFVFFHKEKFNLIDNPLRAFLFLTVIIFIAYSSVKCDILFYSIPIGSLISGVVAIYQYYVLHFPRAFYGQMKIQSGDIAMSLGTLSFIIALYMYDIGKKRLSFLVMVAGGLGVLSSLLSFTRGSLIGAIVAIIVLLYLYKSLLSKKLFALLILGVVCVSPISFNKQFSTKVMLINNDLIAYSKGIKDTSSGVRIDMWKIGEYAFREHPITGWSLQDLNSYKENLVKLGIINKASIPFSHLHNQFIDDLTKKGILGGIGILGIFIVPFIYFYRENRKYKDSKRTRIITSLGMVHILSTMSYCITQNFLTHNSGNIFYFFLVCLFYALTYNENK